MTRDMKLYELRMLVLGYMQNEDPKKAAEVFEIHRIVRQSRA